MLLSDLASLRYAPEQAVIINVGTRLPATLALLSALRHAGMPVVVVDCESKDGSLEWFRRLHERFDFDLVSAPLRPHGKTLDFIFRTVRCDKLLCVDSDLELLGPEALAMMRQYIDDEATFGAGFVDGPGVLVNEPGYLHNAYFQERPWMPLVLLKVAHARQALDAGCSFVDKVVFNDFVTRGRATRAVRRLHELVPRLARLPLRVPAPLRATYNGQRPELVFYDTGAEVYQYLRFAREQLFVGLPARFAPRFATHFGGVSRHVVSDGKSGTSVDSVNAVVAARLREVYAFDVDAAA